MNHASFSAALAGAVATAMASFAVPAAADVTRDWLRDYLAGPIAAGHLTWDIDDVLSRIQPVHSLEAALDGADLMIEAVREDLETKRASRQIARRFPPQRCGMWSPRPTSWSTCTSFRNSGTARWSS